MDHTHHQPSGYRDEIDGLRAVAIAGVLLFHFDLGPLPGGFAGVDVFFVISGYLMTAILVRQPTSLTNLGQFYARRFWRIAPAYYVGLAATLAAGAVLLLPGDAERLGASVPASVFFAANLFFSSGFGYFDTASITKPLLHLWSLSVEMQFYLIWPPVVLGLLRLPRRWHLTAMAAIGVASLVACQILSITDAKAAFFATPARLWEFALGGGVALVHMRGAPGPRPWRSHLVTTALAVILLAMIFVGEDDLWPAPWAIPVALASACILAYGDQPGFGRNLLLARPLRYVGRISYSLYLVHWPVVVFLNYSQFPITPAWLRLAALVACVPVAHGLFHWVERPGRAIGHLPVFGRAPLAAAIMVPALLVPAGLFVHFFPAQLSRWPANPVETTAQMNDYVCTPWHASPGSAPFCVTGDATEAPSTLLWGDSHALQLVPGFAAVLKRAGPGMVIATKDACPPVTGLDRVGNSLVRSTACRMANDRALQLALDTPAIHEVILAARWALYGETTRFGSEKGSRAYLVADESGQLSIENSQMLLRAHLQRQIALLLKAGKTVVLVAQVPEMGFDAQRCVLMRKAYGQSADACAIDLARVVARQAFVTGLLADASEAGNVRVVDPKIVLCDAISCPALLNGQPAYRDDNHLTSFVARILVQRFWGSTGDR